MWYSQITFEQTRLHRKFVYKEINVRSLWICPPFGIFAIEETVCVCVLCLCVVVGVGVDVGVCVCKIERERS